MKLKHLAVQVEPEMLFKFKAVCKHYGRSANGQVGAVHPAYGVDL